MSRQRSNYRLNDNDFYPTPVNAIPDLDWSLFNSIWEPAAGDGRIKDHMTKHCRIMHIFESDLFPQKERIVKSDFLLTADNCYDLIITNPPFSLAQQFITKALGQATNVCMLLRLNFLGSQKRKQFWIDNKPEGLIILSKRPSFTGNGTDACDYAWFCWGPDLPQGLNWM